MPRQAGGPQMESNPLTLRCPQKGLRLPEEEKAIKLHKHGVCGVRTHIPSGLSKPRRTDGCLPKGNIHSIILAHKSAPGCRIGNSQEHTETRYEPGLNLTNVHSSLHDPRRAGGAHMRSSPLRLRWPTKTSPCRGKRGKKKNAQMTRCERDSNLAKVGSSLREPRRAGSPNDILP